MVKKADDVVDIEPTDADLDDVLKEAGIEPGDANREALREALTDVQNHTANAGHGKPTVFVPGVNVHFRLMPTLYTAFVATLGIGITLATLPVSPVIAGASAVYTAAQVIKDIAEKFHHLNAQGIQVMGALSQTIKNRRKTDPAARDARLQDVEAQIRQTDPNLARVAGQTLQVLVANHVVSETPRDDDIYYSIHF